MNAATIIQLSLILLKGVLTEAKANGAVEVVEGVQRAIDEVEKVHGTDITKAQIDSLTITKLW